MPESEFRDLLRAFFARHYPPALRHPSRRLHWHEIRDWHQTLARQGWAAPAWPKACGGMGLSPARQLAFIEEQERYGVARAPDQGIIMVGPLLLQHGSAEQQQRYLPKILSGEHIWCQGYSEPNAGSDLAALRTEAVPDGADFIVNGQKTWTTLAQDATHIFTLVRTDKQAKRQAGISFLLIALDSPGITVRPITTLAGHQEFCEVFFDQVRVPAANLVGGLNQGWGIAKALLGFERIFLGAPSRRGKRWRSWPPRRAPAAASTTRSSPTATRGWSWTWRTWARCTSTSPPWSDAGGAAAGGVRAEDLGHRDLSAHQPGADGSGRGIRQLGRRGPGGRPGAGAAVQHHPRHHLRRQQRDPAQYSGAPRAAVAGLKACSTSLGQARDKARTAEQAECTQSP